MDSTDQLSAKCLEDLESGKPLRSRQPHIWTQSPDNTSADFLLWGDILHAMRRRTKLYYDGFGERRSAEERKKVEEVLHNYHHYK